MNVSVASLSSNVVLLCILLGQCGEAEETYRMGQSAALDPNVLWRQKDHCFTHLVTAPTIGQNHSGIGTTHTFPRLNYFVVAVRQNAEEHAI